MVEYISCMTLGVTWGHSVFKVEFND